MPNLEAYVQLKNSLPKEVQLVAVSKTYPVEDITVLYEAGQRDFGENKVQELIGKAPLLPKDIRWHLIGHLQTNKVKLLLPFVYLIQSVDSLKLVEKINNECEKRNQSTRILLQIKIAEEESKYGLSFNEAEHILQLYKQNNFPNIQILGCMGMATYTENEEQILEEFKALNQFYLQHKKNYGFNCLSMGMSSDYSEAISHGSTLIRVGSLIFGERKLN